MRKSFNQFRMELLEEDQTDARFEAEILSDGSGEDLRGGDRPYMPVIYETATGITTVRPNTLLEHLGLNIHR